MQAWATANRYYIEIEAEQTPLPTPRPTRELCLGGFESSRCDPSFYHIRDVGKGATARVGLFRRVWVLYKSSGDDPAAT